MLDDAFLETRIKSLCQVESNGKCVLYVMSRDQRVADNHALLAAQKHALAKKLPLAVVFCLYTKTGYRTREHYNFMIDGLKQVENALKGYNIPLLVYIGEPYKQICDVVRETEPDAIYFDFNPLRGAQKLLVNLCRVQTCSIFVVDTHNVVPVWEASDKKEVGAYTLRPKLHKRLANFLVEPEQIIEHPHRWQGDVQNIKNFQKHIDQLLNQVPENKTTIFFETGERAATQQLEDFIDGSLKTYAVDRNDPSVGNQSDLSPYLHFGQLSALRVALRLQEEAQKLNKELYLLYSPKMPKSENAEHTTMHGINAIVEEMIVRKELADNFCYYDDNYDNLDSAPAWARASLNKHRDDPREYVYTLEQLEQAQTHDSAWNAAQRQLTQTGRMHGYMRMYWAKKVLEWSSSRLHNNGTHADGPEWAIEVLKYLNDYYSIDGGDPNGYAGILWSVGGVHDRPWQERDIFGKVRYMNYAGLKRKFNITAYEQKWQ